MYVEPVMYMYVFDDLNVQSIDCRDIENCFHCTRRHKCCGAGKFILTLSHIMRDQYVNI